MSVDGQSIIDTPVSLTADFLSHEMNYNNCGDWRFMNGLFHWGTFVRELNSCHLFIINWVVIVLNDSQYSSDPVSIKVFDVSDFVVGTSNFNVIGITSINYFSVIVNFVKLNGLYQNRKIKEIGGNRVLYNDSQMVRLYQK